MTGERVPMFKLPADYDDQWLGNGFAGGWYRLRQRP
jgi:hypothetical protein